MKRLLVLTLLLYTLNLCPLTIPKLELGPFIMSRVTFWCDHFEAPVGMARDVFLIESWGNPRAVGVSLDSEGKVISIDKGLGQHSTLSYEFFKNELNFGHDYDPFDIEMNIYISVKYMRYLKDKYKTWYAVIWCYNGGEWNYSKGIMRSCTVAYTNALFPVCSLYNLDLFMPRTEGDL